MCFDGSPGLRRHCGQIDWLRLDSVSLLSRQSQHVFDEVLHSRQGVVYLVEMLLCLLVDIGYLGEHLGTPQCHVEWIPEVVGDDAGKLRESLFTFVNLSKISHDPNGHCTVIIHESESTLDGFGGVVRQFERHLDGVGQVATEFPYRVQECLGIVVRHDQGQRLSPYFVGIVASLFFESRVSVQQLASLVEGTDRVGRSVEKTALELQSRLVAIAGRYAVVTVLIRHGDFSRYVLLVGQLSVPPYNGVCLFLFLEAAGRGILSDSHERSHMGLGDRTVMAAVGVAILAVHSVVAVGGLTILQWILANPPGLLPLLSVFILVVLVGGYFGYRVGSLQLIARIDGAELSAQRTPALYRRLERLCLDAQLSQPRLLVADLGAPNALSIGGPRSSYVVFDRRLFSLLTIDELEGILAHELAHIERRDTFWNTVAVTAVRTLVGIAFLFLFPVLIMLLGIERGGAWIAGKPDRDRLGLAGYFQQSVLLLLGSLLFLFTIAFYAYSRKQEYAADRRATALTGNPGALARALAKIDRATNPRQGLLSMLYIHDDRNTARRHWLSTHPPIDARIDRLLEGVDGASHQHNNRLRVGR